MAIVRISPVANENAYQNSDGNPLSGGKIYTYVAGSSTVLADTYTTSVGNTLNANPLVLDASGRQTQSIWLVESQYYHIVITDSNNTVIHDYDNVAGFALPIQTGHSGEFLTTDGTNTSWASSGFGNFVTFDDLSSSIDGALGPGLIGYNVNTDYSTDGVDNNLGVKLQNQVVYLDDFFVTGDTNYANAANLACKYCFETGATLRLQGKVYTGARLEVHGSFSIEGNGGTVEYLGIGYTYIAGVGTGASATPTAWGIDPGIYNAAAYAVTMYSPSSNITAGDSTIALNSVTGLAAGDYLFIGGNPASNSSVNNYIPTDFEFVRIKSINSLTITLYQKVKNSYTTAAGLFYSAGLAVDCSIKDLKINTTIDAYQHVIRSAFAVSLSNILFEGEASVGAATFSQNLEYKNISCTGAYNGLSTARGTVQASIDGYYWTPRTQTPLNEPLCLFIEESLYQLNLNNVQSEGGIVFIGSINIGANPTIRRKITLSNSKINTSTALTAGGPTGPVQISSSSGVDITVLNTTLQGAVVTPNSGNFPGITGQALVWRSSCQTNDQLKFLGCNFISTNTGPVFPVALSAMLGNVLFDEMCTYLTVSPPITQWTPRGLWSALSLTSPYTSESGYVTQYRVSNNNLYCTGLVKLNAATSGSTVFTLPSGARPISTKLVGVGAYDASGTVARPAFLTIATDGTVNLFYSGTTSFCSIEFSIPLDI